MSILTALLEGNLASLLQRWQKQTDALTLQFGQSWEDADVVLEAFPVTPETSFLTVSAAGDTTLALLSKGPKKIIAVDREFSQICCLALKKVAYAQLDYEALIAFLGAKPCDKRLNYYQKIRPSLDPSHRAYWDKHPTILQNGVLNSGRAEHFLTMIRRRILPLIHNRKNVLKLIENRTITNRQTYYATEWESWRWHLFFRFLFSRLGRRFIPGEVFVHSPPKNATTLLLDQIKYALTTLNPHDNPYLHWVLFGLFPDILPTPLQPKTVEKIKKNLDCLELRHQPIEETLTALPNQSITHFFLSNLFDTTSTAFSTLVLKDIHRVGQKEGLTMFWQLFAPPFKTEALPDFFISLDETAKNLHLSDKVAIYHHLSLLKLVPSREG